VVEKIISVNHPECSSTNWIRRLPGEWRIVISKLVQEKPKNDPKIIIFIKRESAQRKQVTRPKKSPEMMRLKTGSDTNVTWRDTRDYDGANINAE